MECTTVREELDQASCLISGWSEEVEARGQAKESIAILVRDRYERDCVVSGLDERGVTVRPVDREAVPTGLPVAMTMHRAKGTEFLEVLPFGVGAVSVPKGYSEYEYSDDELDRRTAARAVPDLRCSNSSE